ncbi:MAG: hypothetical protein ACYTGQ_08065 [Planctomycetota bacterium]|jgi:predicted transcriptional regulator
MLSETLQWIIDEEITSARELGEITGVATSTVYRWIRNENQPDFDSVRLMVSHLKDKRATQAIVAAFVAGTNWHVLDTEVDLDLNEDGRVDVEDAIEAAIGAIRTAARSLDQIHTSAREGKITTEQSVELISELNGAIRHCTISQRVLMHMAEARKKRKIR